MKNNVKNTEQILYQIRGLSRCIVAFVFFYQGLVPNLLIYASIAQRTGLGPSTLVNHLWLLYISGLFEVGLAVWLIVAFTEQRPLIVASGVLLFFLLGGTILAPSASLGMPFNVITLTATLLALMYIDKSILQAQRPPLRQTKVGQYLRVTRDKMLYEFVKRLELKDLPHLMHTLAQSRVRRHLRNRQKTKRTLPATSVSNSYHKNGRGQINISPTETLDTHAVDTPSLDEQVAELMKKLPDQSIEAERLD